MKIKKLSFYSLKLIINDTVFVTDPIITQNATGKLPKTEADVVLVTQPEFIGSVNFLEENKINKIEPNKSDSIIQIASSGDYEVGEVIIRRPLGRNFYLLDYDDIRVMYIGEATTALSTSDVNSLGDVDVLILPVGGDNLGVKNDNVEKLVSAVDPTYLIPVGYKEDGVDLKGEYQGVYSMDEFINKFGYTHIHKSKTFKVKASTGVDSKIIEVILLEA